MTTLTPDYFARNEYRDWIVYRELERIEQDPGFKKILAALIEQEAEDLAFWRTLSTQKEFHVSPLYLAAIRLMRRMFGLAFTAKLLENRERAAVRDYTDFLPHADAATRARVEKIIEHEKAHEKTLINKIHEEKMDFMGNIVLGLNDGLIELTGALVGFASALGDHLLVALTGAITGISASLSMAASAYLQAQYEDGKDAKKAALYTGIAYITVVIILIAPFLLLADLIAAIAVMGVAIFAIIGAVTFYGSVVFDRSWGREFSQMALMSIGVASIAFAIGTLFRDLLGVSI